MLGGPLQDGDLRAWRRWPLLVATAVLFSFTACGFRLQGALPLSPNLQRITLQVVDEQSDLAYAIRRNLRQSGATIEPGSTAVLVIERDELLERVASVSARNVPREYELTYLVRFSLKVAGEVRIESEEISLSRDFSFDERVSLAKDREREQLRATLAEEAAVIVLQRVASVR